MTRRASRSEYQRHSQRYYAGVAAADYTETAVTKERPGRTRARTRYTGASVRGVRDLNSFIEGLRRLMRGIPRPRGIDYGCGAHYFVDLCRTAWGWDATGYDAARENIALARRLHPASAAHYIRRDLLADGIPQEDGSQDFVFSNAVFQHFSSRELALGLREIGRVLRPGGILLAVFKIKIPDWRAFEAETRIVVEVLDAAGGRIRIEDPLLKRTLESLPASQRARLDAVIRGGWRLFHVYEVGEVVALARRAALDVVPSVALAGGTARPGIVTYRSGRGIPSAAAFFRKV